MTILFHYLCKYLVLDLSFKFKALTNKSTKCISHDYVNAKVMPILKIIIFS